MTMNESPKSSMPSAADQAADRTPMERPLHGAQWRLQASTVQRWHDVRLQPHRQRYFKLFSTISSFIEKVRDIVWAVPQPAGTRGGAVRGREERRSRRLSASQPVTAHGPFVDVEGVTHDYVRHGTTIVVMRQPGRRTDGTVLTCCKQRHRHQELSVPAIISRRTIMPAALDVHLIGLTDATHKHAAGEGVGWYEACLYPR